MPPRITRQFNWDSGFDPTQTKAGGIVNSIYDGQNAWIWGAGLIESAAGFGANGSSGGANPLMNVGNTHGGCSTGGTVYDAFGSTFCASPSSGTAFKGGVSIGACGPQLEVLRSGVLVPVGLAQPSAPTLTQSATASGKMDGTYSIAITAVDQILGEESTRSLPSAPITISGFKIHVAFPATVASNQTHWGIYCSFKNFGTTGPWFFLNDFPVTPTSVDIDFFNGELGTQAPIDYNTPPPCTHGFAVNNVNVAAGSFGGPGLTPSVPGVPGAFPPDTTVFIPSGGSITGCKATGFAGAIMVATASSLNAVVATDTTLAPINVKQIWPTTGFATGNSWCTIEDEVYGFSGQLGAVRTQGDGPPDTSFATPVHKFFRDNTFTATNTTVIYDPQTDSVMFCKGTICLPFARSRGWWHTPMVLPNSAVTAATVGGQALIDCGGGALFSSELGSGTDWFLLFAFDSGSSPEFNKTVIGARAATSAAATLKIMTNLDSNTAKFTVAISPSHSAWAHTNIRNAVTFAPRLSGVAANGPKQSVYEVVVQLIEHPVRTFDNES